MGIELFRSERGGVKVGVVCVIEVGHLGWMMGSIEECEVRSCFER